MAAMDLGELVVQVRTAAEVKAEALREAADLIYSDEGPAPGSLQTWLRFRADRIEHGEI